MRRALLFPLMLAAPLVCVAWHDPVHARITRAALQSLPIEMQQRLAAQSQLLIERYSLYPDAFAGAKGAERERMLPFCARPDGGVIHNVTWKRNEDIASLEYTLDSVISALRSGDAGKAAQHAGVLAHFIEDSTCPAHALMPADSQLNTFRDLIPPPTGKEGLKLHTVIERSSPEFALSGRAPLHVGSSVPQAAGALLDRVYARIKETRAQLIDLVRAVYRDDEAAMDRERLATARAGAEILADAYYSAFRLQ